MNVTGIQSDGDSVKIKYSTLVLIAPLLSVVFVVTGWISSYFIFKSDLSNLAVTSIELKAMIAQMQIRENTLRDTVVQDRNSDSNRLIAIEGDIRRIVQDIAEIKAFPRRQER